jgi:hypothetical protein
MRSWTAYGESRLLSWLRVREFAVPPSMIETATARRAAGDWAGACAAAHVDVDVNLGAVARTQGADIAALVRADLRHLAPDLLRWHFPRIAPDGLLRPGLTVSLAGYHHAGPDIGGAVHLVARTPPAWAGAGQRISLALWDGARRGDGPPGHPHPNPDRRFRLDLHRHLWDARRVGELRERSGTGRRSADEDPFGDQASAALVPRETGCAVDRWAAEAAILLDADGCAGHVVTVRLGSRRRLLLELGMDGDACGQPALRITAPQRRNATAWPILPDAATWVLPDLELLRVGMIDADRLHPLVASALIPGRSTSGIARPSAAEPGTRLVECRGAQHRIGLVNGVLVALDHDPAEIRREDLLATLGGTPLPCLRAIDQVYRHPECLDDVRARLDHGDAVGALAVVEELLGPDPLLRNGALREELETAVRRRIDYGLYRTGLPRFGPIPPAQSPRGGRSHPRHASR